jgi:hypothetical protein
MLNRTLILAIAAVLAIVIGAATSFFELIALGIVVALVAVGLGLRRRAAHEVPGR